MTEAMKQYESWLSYPGLDKNIRDELEAIREIPEEIEDRFFTSMEFGTGGIRGILRAGTNGMNIYTVRQATQGLANLIVKIG